MNCGDHFILQNVNMCNMEQNTPLHYAVLNAHKPVSVIQDFKQIFSYVWFQSYIVEKHFVLEWENPMS
jgi:hypothetical protein